LGILWGVKRIVSVFKEIAAIGADHIISGTINFDSWSELMIHDIGQNIKPFLQEVRQLSLLIAQKKTGAQDTKINCWEYQKCGREANGENIQKLGICDVYLESTLDGIHGGKRGGRACWVVRDIKCGSKMKRTFVPHYVVCTACGFKRNVIKEENSDCIISDDFLKMLIYRS
jgi:hypothetical protein